MDMPMEEAPYHKYIFQSLVIEFHHTRLIMYMKHLILAFISVLCTQQIQIRSALFISTPSICKSQQRITSFKQANRSVEQVICSCSRKAPQPL